LKRIKKERETYRYHFAEKAKKTRDLEAPKNPIIVREKKKTAISNNMAAT